MWYKKIQCWSDNTITHACTRLKKLKKILVVRVGVKIKRGFLNVLKSYDDIGLIKPFGNRVLKLSLNSVLEDDT